MLRAHVMLKKQYKADDMEIPDFPGHDCSYKALNGIKRDSFSTKWGPVGFSKNRHPLAIMVRNKLDYRDTVVSS